MLSSFLLDRVIQNNLIDEDEVKIPTLDLAFVRFITGIIMHIAMTDEIKLGMAKMKYALNH